MSKTTKWKLAPLPPTTEMVMAGIKCAQQNGYGEDIYTAMLAVAPKPGGGTPETDALENKHLKRMGIADFYALEIVESLELARKLERQRNAVLAEVTL